MDAATADIARVDARIDELIAPFAAAVERLDEITDVGRTAAQVAIPEIGLDTARFPTPGHLCSWAKFAPGVSESAGKDKGAGATGHGNPYLARVLGEAAVAAGKTDTFLGERYRRIARRSGAKKAIIAVGRSILVIMWHLLSDPDTRFRDLGTDYFARHTNTQRKIRNHISQLNALAPELHTTDPAPLRYAECLRPAHSPPIFGSEGDDLIGPRRPAGEVVEGGAFHQGLGGDAAGIEAGAAAAHVGAAAGGGLDHPVQVVAAVRHLLPRHGTADRVADQETRTAPS
ncbi:transposase [Amycolatopsis mongoliensis]|uniref:Transposase n=1 Tax=Amycolatopsis mongoliensis TaxID=715475 RepID=A0A9Y2JM31_9PSEU|nr:transposase [Amycolatopsis sp. 4-36]WIY01025.1 transposase [Amycolatopsis sp. 4-36]